MANELNELITRVTALDAATGDEVRRQLTILSNRRENGLNFERHLPEQVALVGRPISVGDKVRFIPERGKTAVESTQTWIVTKLTGPKGQRIAELAGQSSENTASRKVDDLVYVADFRDPIYPGLKPTGRVERGGDKPFHAVINAENYHALEALAYTHAGKVDAIYVDPPYNTRARDWKYNNDYVDPTDDYAHSRWLSFIERRLKLAKKLLNPNNSVLIATIDEKEYLRLGLLLEQTFPTARRRMISSLINPKGVGVTEGFKRVDEYIFILRFGEQQVTPSTLAPLGSQPMTAGPRYSDDDEPAGTSAAQDALLEEPHLEAGVDDEPTRIRLDWQTARRRDLTSVRRTRPGQFFPIYVNETTDLIQEIGETIPHEMDRQDAPQRAGCVAVFPIRDDGTEMNWAVTAPTFRARWSKGYARAGKATPAKPQKYIIQYLKSGPIADIEDGRALVEGRNPDGSVIAFYEDAAAKAPPTQWNVRSHNAEHYGTKVLRALLPGRSFPFPKSLYAVEDVLRLFLSDKPDALVLDFFSGSGTTAHAVMRLNRQDDGRRRSISVTNNEVSADEYKALVKAHLRPGDTEWEALGICDHITKPRIAAAVSGVTPAGDVIKGAYKFTDVFPMAEGFEENVEFLTLTYLNHKLVELDLAFNAVAPLLWMRAGSQGRRIEERSNTFDIADTYAVLFKLDASGAFLQAAEQSEGVRVVFIVTDDETQFQAVASQLPEGVETVQLYESYLSTFSINTERG